MRSNSDSFISSKLRNGTFMTTHKGHGSFAPVAALPRPRTWGRHGNRERYIAAKVSATAVTLHTFVAALSLHEYKAAHSVLHKRSAGCKVGQVLQSDWKGIFFLPLAILWFNSLRGNGSMKGKECFHPGDPQSGGAWRLGDSKQQSRTTG